MDLGVESLLVVIFFLLPGYLGLFLWELMVAPRDRSAFQETAVSLLFSLLGAAVLLSIPITKPLMRHLEAPSEFSAKALIGTGLQVIVVLAIAGVLGLFVTRVLKGRFGTRSVYTRAWDGLWVHHAYEPRFIGVAVQGGAFVYGTLEYADDPLVGRSLVLRDPRLWDPDREDYFSTGSELVYIPGDRIDRVEVSPLPQSGGPTSAEGD